MIHPTHLVLPGLKLGSSRQPQTVGEMKKRGMAGIAGPARTALIPSNQASTSIGPAGNYLADTHLNELVPALCMTRG
jgi:hypothetical protein